MEHQQWLACRVRCLAVCEPIPERCRLRLLPLINQFLHEPRIPQENGVLKHTAPAPIVQHRRDGLKVLFIPLRRLPRAGREPDIRVCLVERPDVIRSGFDLCGIKYNIEFVVSQIFLASIIFKNHAVVPMFFGVANNRCFCNVIRELFRGQFHLVRIFHFEIGFNDTVSSAFICHALCIIPAFTEEVRSVLLLESIKFRIRPVVHHLRCPVRIHDLTRALRVILPVPKPALELLRLCYIF